MDKKMPKKISLKDFGMEKIILIAIAGIVLLAANFSEWKNSSSKTSEKQEKSIETSQNDAYVEALENKLVHILENVDGVGKAEVMITLKSSKESVLNKDLSEEKQTEEERSGETQKVNKNQKKQEETILSDSSGNSAPYVIKELEPEISGIVISCEGAGNKVVEASVLEAVQVLFGVSANHIKDGGCKMKKVFQKNQIAITALAIMIAVAGYLNFTEQNTSSDGTKKTAGSVETIDTMDISDGDSLIKEKAKASKDVSKSLSKNSSENAKETQTDASSETIGDAVLTQAQVSEYVAGARMEREQTHSKTKESLNEIINSTSVSEDAKKEAVDKLTELADIMEKESATEQLLASKGFEDAVVSIGEDSVDVVLNYEELSSSDRAQIEDIVTRKTGYSVSQLVISKMQTTES